MANTARLRGAWPVGKVLRSFPYVAGGTVYPGDFVKFDSAGKVVAASASDALCGVAQNYATTGQTITVFDDPSQKFGVQTDDATDPDAQTDINLNYDFVATAGDTTYKRSKMSLDGSTGATTATLPLKLLAIEPRPDNALGAAVDCIVKINNHQLGSATGTAGV